MVILDLQGQASKAKDLTAKAKTMASVLEYPRGQGLVLEETSQLYLLLDCSQETLGKCEDQAKQSESTYTTNRCHAPSPDTTLFLS